MPLTHVTKIFAVTDAKIAKLTADPAGGSPTYATAVDVPGIKSIKIEGDIDVKELRGDNQLLDKDAVIKNLKATIGHAKLSFDALGAMLSAAAVDAGTTPNQTVTWDLLGSSTRNYFSVSGVSLSSDVIGGNVSLKLHKCVLSSMPDLGFEEEDYQLSSFEVEAMPLLANNKWLSAVLNETAVLVAP